MESSRLSSIFFFLFTELSLLSFTAKPAAGMIKDTISSAPTILPNFAPAQSPYQEISPDIAPLSPTPGTEASSPSDSSMPIIPSSLSPPNPDSIAGSGVDPVVSPSSSFSPHSSSTSVADALLPTAVIVRSTGFVVLVTYWFLYF